MIWIDYTIIGLIFISSVIGLLRGFIKEAFSLVIWVAAAWVALTFSKEFSVFLVNIISVPSVRVSVAFGCLFLITLVVGALISYLLSELVKKTGLTGSDRFAGMVFGITRGLIVVSIAVMMAGLTPLPEDLWWKESILIPPFQLLAVWFRDHIPSGLTDYVNF
ncbi:MAG: CvpA family protein [Methylococcales bacterium]|nr:CvpA family protein [Methylococcales bacterium]